MPKLTLSFKGRLIAVHHFGDEALTIGRDPDCGFTIDSLAIAPRHAEIALRDDGRWITALDPEFKVIVNGESVSARALRHDDLLQLGKHTLSYAEEPAASIAAPDAAPVPIETPDPAAPGDRLGGFLQVMSGQHLGRIIPLRRSLVRLGRSGSDCAVIALRDNGYFLSHLEGAHPPKVNGVAIGDRSHRLESGEMILIGETEMRFFDGNECGRGG